MISMKSKNKKLFSKVIKLIIPLDPNPITIGKKIPNKPQRIPGIRGL